MNNRQNGRRRGRGGNNPRGNNPGRPDTGNRIDNRARGNANQLYEKYKNLARDAQMSGDRVNTEYYLQFADHYFRVLSESRARFEEQNPGAPQQRRIQPVDSFDDFDDGDDYGDEGEPIRAGEQGDLRMQRDSRDGQGRDSQGRDNQGRDGQGREGQGRDSSGRDYQGGNSQRDYREAQRPRQESRHDGRRDEQRGYGEQRADARPAPRREFDRDARNDAGGAADRIEDDRITADRATGDRAGPDAGDMAGIDPLAATGSPIANDLNEDSPDGSGPTPIEGRRRGRPRKVAATPAADGGTPVATDDGTRADAPEGMAGNGLDADRLPPSLSLVPSADGDAEAPPRRRRRTRAATAETPAG